MERLVQGEGGLSLMKDEGEESRGKYRSEQARGQLGAVRVELEREGTVD